MLFFHYWGNYIYIFFLKEGPFSNIQSRADGTLLHNSKINVCGAMRVVMRKGIWAYQQDTSHSWNLASDD